MRVGFVGLGQQGAPMARRILAGGFALTIWARRPEPLSAFLATEAVVAPSLADLGRAADLVGVCVVDDAGVDQVVNGLLPGMAAGGVVAVHSTVHPDTCRRLAARAGERGVTLLDAPVSGGGGAAAAGRLAVMVGGDPDAYQRCLPVWRTFGDPVRHVGPVGAGQLTKLLNNLLFTAHLGLGWQALDQAARLGLDRATVSELIQRASGGSTALGIVSLLPSLAPLAGAAGLLAKDVALAAQAGIDAGGLLDAARGALDLLQGNS